jgi:hypothetical protein
VFYSLQKFGNSKKIVLPFIDPVRVAPDLLLGYSLYKGQQKISQKGLIKYQKTQEFM